jgi:hypothetical protein
MTMARLPRSQEEFEELLFSVGHCTGCGSDTKKLAMVEMTDAEMDGKGLDLYGPKRGLCYACAVMKYVTKPGKDEQTH